MVGAPPPSNIITSLTPSMITHKYSLEIIAYPNKDYYGKIRLLIVHTHS